MRIVQCRLVFIVGLTSLASGCTVIPAKEIAIARECEKSGGIVEEIYNPFKPWAIGFRCVKP